MQLRGVVARQDVMSRLTPFIRTLLALGFGLMVAALPISQVAACSCGVGETADVIRRAQLAFVGTVADQRDTGRQNPFGDEMREYAFMVERSTLPTDEIATIVAGRSGPSCGITFANGEEWLVISRRTAEGLETNLCSGNLRMSDIGEDERAAIIDMMPSAPSATPGAAEVPSEPSEAPAETAEPSRTGSVAVPILIGGIGVLILGTAGLLLLRRRGVS